MRPSGSGGNYRPDPNRSVQGRPNQPPPHEACHFDTWERPSDYYAPTAPPEVTSDRLGYGPFLEKYHRQQADQERLLALNQVRQRNRVRPPPPPPVPVEISQPSRVRKTHLTSRTVYGNGWQRTESRTYVKLVRDQNQTVVKSPNPIPLISSATTSQRAVDYADFWGNGNDQEEGPSTSNAYRSSPPEPVERDYNPWGLGEEKKTPEISTRSVSIENNGFYQEPSSSNGHISVAPKPVEDSLETKAQVSNISSDSCVFSAAEQKSSSEPVVPDEECYDSDDSEENFWRTDRIHEVCSRENEPSTSTSHQPNSQSVIVDYDDFWGTTTENEEPPTKNDVHDIEISNLKEYYENWQSEDDDEIDKTSEHNQSFDSWDSDYDEQVERKKEKEKEKLNMKTEPSAPQKPSAPQSSNTSLIPQKVFISHEDFWGPAPTTTTTTSDDSWVTPTTSNPYDAVDTAVVQHVQNMRPRIIVGGAEKMPTFKLPTTVPEPKKPSPASSSSSNATKELESSMKKMDLKEPTTAKTPTPSQLAKPKVEKAPPTLPAKSKKPMAPTKIEKPYLVPSSVQKLAIRPMVKVVKTPPISFSLPKLAETPKTGMERLTSSSSKPDVQICQAPISSSQNPLKQSESNIDKPEIPISFIQNPFEPSSKKREIPTLSSQITSESSKSEIEKIQPPRSSNQMPSEPAKLEAVKHQLPTSSSQNPFEPSEPSRKAPAPTSSSQITPEPSKLEVEKIQPPRSPSPNPSETSTPETVKPQKLKASCQNPFDTSVPELKNAQPPATSSSQRTPNPSEPSRTEEPTISTSLNQKTPNPFEPKFEVSQIPTTSSQNPVSPPSPSPPFQSSLPEPIAETTIWSTPVPKRHNGPRLSVVSAEASTSYLKRDGSSKEEKAAKMVSPIEHLTRLYNLEDDQNVFSQFYTKSSPHQRSSRRSGTKTLKSYKHQDALEFAAMTYTWRDSSERNLPVLPSLPHIIMPLPSSYPGSDEICAFYRVLSEQEQKYILIACHVNVHGYHRGDLRFIEVTSRTRLRGVEGSNPIGNLFPGDIVAVTELVRSTNTQSFQSNISVSSVSQDTVCYWIASKIILYPRANQSSQVTFSFLKNRMAVVKGKDEPMLVTVDDWDAVRPDLIYAGQAFEPQKLEINFTEDYQKKKKNNITSKITKISSYPNSFGTIFEFKECKDKNKQFKIGINAFSEDTDLDLEKREEIVETCSLMGFSAANTLFNGRFDCRAFHMHDIYKSGSIVKFRIDNPPSQPTLGLWNNGNRVMFGGPLGDVNASIETVISDNEALFITARISRDCPKGMDFTEGDYFVSQREMTDHYFLHDGYFQVLEHDSNGRRIIETLYGGKPIEKLTEPVERKTLDYGIEYARPFDLNPSTSTSKPKKSSNSKHNGQYYFPSVPQKIALNKYQNEYVKMLLDGNPLIIGSSPFGCGKSMTIITAALEIYKRNCETNILQNQTQQLLITQSNYASVNLIEIAKRICSSGDSSLQYLQFVRYVSEKNWNELPDNARTDYDMPHLMNSTFAAWATGRIPENDRRLKRLQNNHFNHMLAYVLKNHVVSIHELSGTARKCYDRSGEFRTPFNTVVTEAFFSIYQPDLIMTTADSSKNLLTVLKEVCTVQIDEASQLPEYTLLGLLKTFPRANFGLIGDIHQLPPYCDDTLDGRLKDYGIGNTMERAIQENLFPTSVLRCVYRCHPKTTKLLSELFYDGVLISGVEEDQRKEFVTKRSDLWPNPEYPIMIIDNKGSSFKMGTSTGNDTEKTLVGKLVNDLTTHRKNPMNPLDIGVISFYAAQTSILTEHLRGSGVKCGTVDAFQGTEKEVIIMCCTNEIVSDFMQLSNRLNVAMSRAKQATIVVGNLDGLRKAKYWKTIVKRVEEHRNVVGLDGRCNLTRIAPPPTQSPPESIQMLDDDDSSSKKKSKKSLKINPNIVAQIENLRASSSGVPNGNIEVFQGNWDSETYTYTRPPK
ncbi:hypothetical protein CRE_07669 [Caenorhabditis remanei]|uniref:DNA2/NAM7 helicase-like C-terminal domain-containing protein n=1 Tax=Caenorhabditis remanei TaxID=31234 RepID=E3MZT4_CAERE|nr:hypothetical protein CRE_07669 [Caenorhabditis remanei]